MPVIYGQTIKTKFRMKSFKIRIMFLIGNDSLIYVSSENYDNWQELIDWVVVLSQNFPIFKIPAQFQLGM